mgnify:CR=1 FL=1
MGQTILKTGDLLSDDPNFATWIKKSDGYGYFYRPEIFEAQKEIVIRPDTVCAKD